MRTLFALILVAASVLATPALAAMSAVNTPLAYQAGTVGQLLPGIDAQVVAVPGIERGGMLHVRGPNLMSGYLRFEAPGRLEPPASEAGDGWYNTGDVVEIDPAGFVTILGRVKRFAKIAGEMVSLEVVEKLAVAASPAHPHAATSVADESAAKPSSCSAPTRRSAATTCSKRRANTACRKSPFRARSACSMRCPCWVPAKPTIRR